MPYSRHLENLRGAVARELAECSARDEEYRSLVAKMKAYQEGDGPAPTVEDFERWKAAVANQLRVASLQSGFGELN